MLSTTKMSSEFEMTKSELQKAFDIIKWGSKDYDEYKNALSTFQKLIENLPKSFELEYSTIRLSDIINAFKIDFNGYDDFKVLVIKEGEYIFLKDNHRNFVITIYYKWMKIVNINFLNTTYNPPWLMRLFINKAQIKIDYYYEKGIQVKDEDNL